MIKIFFGWQVFQCYQMAKLILIKISNQFHVTNSKYVKYINGLSILPHIPQLQSKTKHHQDQNRKLQKQFFPTSQFLEYMNQLIERCIEKYNSEFTDLPSSTLSVLISSWSSWRPLAQGMINLSSEFLPKMVSEMEKKDTLPCLGFRFRLILTTTKFATQSTCKARWSTSCSSYSITWIDASIGYRNTDKSNCQCE